MRLPARFFWVFLLCLACVSCGGYSLTSMQPSVLGDGDKTLKVKAIDNPTMYAWLPYALRSALRDEVNARNLARWQDSGATDLEIRLTVHSFQIRGDARSARDVTLLYTATMRLSAMLYDGPTNTVKWQSGILSYSETYEAANAQEAARELSRELIRRLTDRMRQKF